MKRRLRRLGMVVAVTVGALNVANFGAQAVWAGTNPCLRSHVEVATHVDPNDGDPVIDVCDWYKTDPDRNPWLPGNELHTLTHVLAQVTS